MNISEGQNFGCFTIIEQINSTEYKVKCKCEHIYVKSVKSLKKSKNKNCIKCSQLKETINIGDKFGEITIIEKLGRKIFSNKYRWVYKVKCSCGYVYEAHSGELPIKRKYGKKSCKNCKGKQIRKFNIGDKVGNLTVIDYITKNKRSLIKLRCDCGNEIIRRAYIDKNMTNSCGCQPNGSWQGIGEISGTIFHYINQGAKARNLDITITKEYIWELYLKQNKKCKLSGVNIGFNPRTASLDRIDNSKGYIEGNVQWVHKDINLMRMQLSVDSFINWCKLISNYNSQNNYIVDYQI